MSSGPGDPPVFAVLGLFPSAQRLVEAIHRVRAGTEDRLEAYTPYPVHGIDRALGLRRSPLGGMVLIMAIIGAASALLFQYWTSAVDYPIVTAGKPESSWEAFVPILFEVMVLFATFTAGLGMLILLNRLPFFRHPILRSRSMPAITRDRFALSIEADGAALDVEAMKALLLDAGAESVEVLERDEPPRPVSPRFILRTFLAVVLACVVAGLATYWAVKLFPTLPPMVHMQDQPRVDPQDPSGFFKDRASMQMPAAGSVARGHMPLPPIAQEDAAVLSNPLPRSLSVLERGRRAYEDRCAVCHGRLGDGGHRLGPEYGAKPASLLSKQTRDSPDGKIYHTIAAGKNAMPSYAADLDEDERWAVVHYLRALERSQDARDEDVK